MTKLDKYILIGSIASVVLANTALSFAQDLDEIEAVSLSNGYFEETVDAEAVAPVETNVAEGSEEISNTEKQDAFLSRLKDELNLSKTDYRQVLNSISDTNAKLEEVSEDKLTLAQQLDNLDYMIDVTTGKLFDVIRQVVEKEGEITLLYEQIEFKEVAIAYQKDLIKDYFRVIYQEENNYFSIGDDGEIQAFKLLLADDSVGNNLKDLKYFDLLNEAGQQMIDQLEVLSVELKDYQIDLNKKKIKLVELQEELSAEKVQLELQRESKENLLALTKGQETVYQQLLEQTLLQQEALLNDVKNLGNAVAFIERKIAEQGADFNPDDYLSLLDYKTQVLYNFHLNNNFAASDGFIWPVDPDRGISAYFRDSGYVGVFGVQHNAVDIPEYQGSPFRAAADGVVYTARDNGYGYSYIILAHAGGLMSVYGHVSNILVAEGDVVSQGSIIGLTGGMPGSIGAGYMTTGPHLHFEVLLNGLYVDPLDYLPLDIFSEEEIAGMPEKYYDDWEADVGVSTFEALDRF